MSNFDFKTATPVTSGFGDSNFFFGAISQAAATPIIGTFSGLKTYMSNTPTLVTPALGTPTSGVLTNCTALPLTTGVTGNLPVANLNSGTGASASTFWRGDGTWAVAGVGSVTSVAQTFTGGLISVSGSPITSSGTLALTVAGTSGGIPYFSSSSAWASSGVLAASAIMLGGGAGSAPATTTTGTGVVTALGVNVGSAGAFVVFNGALGTPSSGTLTSCTGLPISTGVSGLGTGVATALAVNTGSAGAVVLFNGALGTPSSGTLSNATGLPLTTGVTGNLPVTNLNSGTSASSSTFWRGDGTWATPSSVAGSIVVGTTTITSGANTRILYDNAGTLGEYTITGTGTVVAMQTSASLITPALGVATATSLAINGATIGSNALAVTGGVAGSAQIWSGAVSSALGTLTGSSDGFRSSAANVTQFAGENTTSSSSTAGGFFGGYSNDGAAMASGDRLGGMRVGGSSSASAIRNSALIGAFASQAWVDASAYGSRWEFQTTTNSATTPTTKLILGNSGVLSFGATEANTVPALKPSSTTLQVRLGDDSAFANLSAASLDINGSSSGVVSILPQAAAGTFNFNLPTTAGTSGYVLTSAGGGSSPMTWTAPGSLAIGLTVGSTAIGSGTTTRILYDNAGTLGEYTISGSGTVVAMATSPTLVTPTLGVATATTLGVGAAVGSSIMSVIGTITDASNTGMVSITPGLTFTTGSIAMYGVITQATTTVSGGSSHAGYGFFMQNLTAVSNSASIGLSATVFARSGTSGASPTGTISSLEAFSIGAPTLQHSGSPSLTISTTKGLGIGNQGISSSGITASTAYGIYVDAQSGASTNYSAWFNGGIVHSVGQLRSDAGLIAYNGTATPVAASAIAGLQIGSAAVGIYIGTGDPTAAAAKGSLYIRTDATTTTTRLWINTNGSTTWTNFTTAA